MVCGYWPVEWSKMDFDKKRKNAWISPLKTGLIIFKTEIKIVKFCFKFLFLETEV